MIKQKAQLKARRVFRSRKRQVGDFADSASRGADRHIFRRIQNFGEVARFSVAWILLIMVLISSVIFQTRGLEKYHLSYQPVIGGVYTEGVSGTFTNASPIFAATSVDLSVSRLIFNSLLTYDYSGKLVNDLAESISKDEAGLVYTVLLKPGVRWQDGEPFVADDVVFTYQMIQHPDTKSPYNLSWQGIKIAAPNQSVVTFTLPTSLSSFPLSLTTGIVPKHILSRVSPAQLRSSDFNTSPIGTGPFKLTKIDRVDDLTSNTKKQLIELSAYSGYFKKTPDLSAFVLKTYGSDDELNEALKNRDIDAASLSDYPAKILQDQKGVLTSASLLGGTYIFMNTARDSLSSVDIRHALTLGTNIPELLNILPYPVRKVNGPLLSTQAGYDAAYVQNGYNLAAAQAKLDGLGWARQGTDIRTKDGKQLEFGLVTTENSDLALIAGKLQAQWAQDLGIKLVISLKDSVSNQQAILQHNYDILLYGISIGADPDVYAYWHSSQAVVDRFNVSNYKSAVADEALESGRTRTDSAVRSTKYRQFLTAWRDDAPAIGLYQPVAFYVTSSKLYGYEPQLLSGVSDRYYNVENWRTLVSKQPIVQTSKVSP